MFGQNKVEKLNKEEEISEQVNQDFLVHNMPSPQNFNAGPATNTRLVSGGELLSGLEKPKHNFKMAGVLIILGGLLLIGGLIYASYVFIIKPSAPAEPITTVIEEATQNPESIIDIINANKETEASEETLIDDVNVIETITPEILDLATSSTSSTLEEITEEVINESATLKPLIDSDNDGLYDHEEELLGTNPSMIDSNSNGYADLVEINNGYDPVVAGEKLNLNANLEEYLNQTFNYKILYPRAWKLSILDNDDLVVFTASDNSIIQISVQENINKQGILGWYSDLFPSEALTYDKLKLADSWEGVWGSDNLNFYLTDKAKKNIYVISFISPVDGQVAYPNIYKLMINSLKIN